LSFVAIFFAYFGYEYLNSRFSLAESESGLGIRSQAINMYLNNLNPINLIFGLGMFNDFFVKSDSDIVPQDLGLWFTVLTSGGVVGILLLFIFFIIALPRKIRDYSIAIILMLSKLTLTNALVWVIFFYFLSYNLRNINFGNSTLFHPIKARKE
jgi:hypothetical protein